MNRSVTALIVAVLMVVSTVVGGQALSFGKYEKVKAENGTVSIALSKVSNGKAHFFKFADNGKEIAFFVVKASDGSLRVAFDACDACYRDKKGYEQQGDKMNCRNCNQKFAINRLGPNVSGGCNPGYLPGRTSGSAFVIKADDLKQGARYF